LLWATHDPCGINLFAGRWLPLLSPFFLLNPDDCYSSTYVNINSGTGFLRAKVISTINYVGKGQLVDFSLFS